MAATESPAVLLVDKPSGPTSHDVVRVARRALGVRRVGHTGTLDPFASGLLILCVGKATRLVEYFHLLSKTYSARALLGVETDTEDRTGRVTKRSDAWSSLAPGDVDRIARQFVGELEQVPPGYSAKKVGGKRAYEAARDGEPMDLAARPVHVHSLEVSAVRLPELEFRVRVSTGTYVRSLARDLGRALGCGAHLAELRREAIGPFSVDQAASLGALESGDLPRSSRISAVHALGWLPRRSLSHEERVAIGHGQPIHARAGDGESGGPVVLVHEERLVAIGRWDADVLKPEKVFADA